jgi:hypothetical protein
MNEVSVAGCFAFSPVFWFLDICMVVSWFNLYFLEDMMLNTFYALVCHVVSTYLIWWGDCSYIWPIFCWNILVLLCFKSSLHILDTSSLSNMLYKYFSWFANSHFILLTMSSRAKAFYFKKVKHHFFSFMNYACGVDLKTHHQTQSHLDIFSVLFLDNIILFQVRFRFIE